MLGKTFGFYNFISVVICLILSVSCSSETTKYVFSGDLREFAHPNGLTVKLPKTLAAQRRENGFLIEPADASNEDVRKPLMIWINKREDAGEELSALTNVRQKIIRNRTVYFQIERTEGGSGGEQYYFMAWEKVNRSFVVYKEIEQSEDGEPEFANCWRVIANTALGM